MARCTLCVAEARQERGNRPEEWLFTEFHGPRGNKYGVYCPGHPWEEIRASLVGLAEAAAVSGAGVPLTDAGLAAEIRARRADMDARIAAGTLDRPRPLTYDKKGPSIKGGPEGWRKGEA